MRFTRAITAEWLEKRGITISSLTYDPVAHENESQNRDNSIWCQGAGACVLCDEENEAWRVERQKHYDRFDKKPDVPWCEGFPECVRCEKARDF